MLSRNMLIGINGKRSSVALRVLVGVRVLLFISLFCVTRANIRSGVRTRRLAPVAAVADDAVEARPNTRRGARERRDAELLELRPQRARLADGLVVPLPAELAGNTSAGQQIVLGFRPESLAPKGHALHNEAESISLSRTVVIAEPLGTETIVFTELAGREVQGRMLNPRPVKPGETMDFVLDLTRLHVFDKASGKSLRG